MSSPQFNKLVEGCLCQSHKQCFSEACIRGGEDPLPGKRQLSTGNLLQVAISGKDTLLLQYNKKPF